MLLQFFAAADQTQGLGLMHQSSEFGGGGLVRRKADIQQKTIGRVKLFAAVQQTFKAPPEMFTSLIGIAGDRGFGSGKRFCLKQMGIRIHIVVHPTTQPRHQKMAGSKSIELLQQIISNQRPIISELAVDRLHPL